jgi:hypothetical protein
MISSISGGFASQAAAAASREVDCASSEGDAKPIDLGPQSGGIQYDNNHSGQAATLAMIAMANRLDNAFAHNGRF